MKRFKLTKEEKEIEKALLKGEYFDIPEAKFREIAHAIHQRKKEAVLHIRINQQVLDNLKRKAKRLGVGYQTFISELLHRFAA